MDELPSTPPHTAHDLPLQLTPIKTNLATTQPFTTHHKFRIDSCSAMGEEMVKYISGLMPAQVFLDEFLPLNGLKALKGTTHKLNCYLGVVKVKKEKSAYDPFVSSICIFTLLYSLYHCRSRQLWVLPLA